MLLENKKVGDKSWALHMGTASERSRLRLRRLRFTWLFPHFFEILFCSGIFHLDTVSTRVYYLGHRLYASRVKWPQAPSMSAWWCKSSALIGQALPPHGHARRAYIRRSCGCWPPGGPLVVWRWLVGGRPTFQGHRRRCGRRLCVPVFRPSW